MAVFRVEKNKGYTVMSNYHLQDKNLSLKAKGLLSMMLSFPDNWNYTMRGLVKVCKEGLDAISTGIKELEKNGYIVRRKLRDANGRITDTEYIIYEQPQLPDTPSTPDTQPVIPPESPDSARPYPASPYPDFPDMVDPDSENPTQLITNIVIKNQTNTNQSITHSFPSTPAPDAKEAKGKKEQAAINLEEIKAYRLLILENIGYDILVQERPDDVVRLNELVELMLEAVCSNCETIRIAGNNFPQKFVQSRFLKLTGEHIRFVLDCLRENTTKIRNMKQYLLTVLYNAPTTIENARTARNQYEAAQSVSGTCQWDDFTMELVKNLHRECWKEGSE